MKNIEVLNFEQGTPEWHSARKGIITGTRLDLVMREGRGGKPSAMRTGLIYELIWEQTADYEKQQRSTQAMERGHLGEAILKETTEVESVGFIRRTDIPWLGISPDGLMQSGGEYTHALEIKTPEPKAYVRYCIENQTELPEEYRWQVVHYFVVIDTLETLDFTIACPEMLDSRTRSHTIRITREAISEDIEKARAALSEFRSQWLETLQEYARFFTQK